MFKAIQTAEDHAALEQFFQEIDSTDENVAGIEAFATYMGDVANDFTELDHLIHALNELDPAAAKGVVSWLKDDIAEVIGEDPTTMSLEKLRATLEGIEFSDAIAKEDFADWVARHPIAATLVAMFVPFTWLPILVRALANHYDEVKNNVILCVDAEVADSILTDWGNIKGIVEAMSATKWPTTEDEYLKWCQDTVKNVNTLTATPCQLMISPKGKLIDDKAANKAIVANTKGERQKLSDAGWADSTIESTGKRIGAISMKLKSDTKTLENKFFKSMKVAEVEIENLDKPQRRIAERAFYATLGMAVSVIKSGTGNVNKVSKTMVRIAKVLERAAEKAKK